MIKNKLRRLLKVLKLCEMISAKIAYDSIQETYLSI